jgi:uncharacterized membrane protein YjdF
MSFVLVVISSMIELQEWQAAVSAFAEASGFLCDDALDEIWARSGPVLALYYA